MDDAHHMIDELHATHEEVTVEKLTYLSKVNEMSLLGSRFMEIEIYLIE